MAAKRELGQEVYLTLPGLCCATAPQGSSSPSGIHVSGLVYEPNGHIPGLLTRKDGGGGPGSGKIVNLFFSFQPPLQHLTHPF
jgi:hypothetical protein